MIYSTLATFEARNVAWRWPNFTAKELACKCCGEYYHDPDFLDKLQQLRNVFAKPLRINSGHRCEENNRRVGGAKSSRHLLIAADIDISRMTLTERRNLARIAVEAGFTGLGRARTFLHVDNRPGKLTEWHYGDSAKVW